MSEWKAKRFWKAASVAGAEGGFAVLLDERPVKTPAKRPLVLPTRELAQAIASEWDEQAEVIDPLSMPFTRSANAAIDKVADQHSEVAEIVAAYGDSDLLCYRATEPESLVTRQSAKWDRWLDWARSEFGVSLAVRKGVMHVPQDPATLARLAGEVRQMDAFMLTAFHDLVALSGSLVLAFAVERKATDAEIAWSISRVDEDWQSEQWGEDEEAADSAALKRKAFLHAARFLDMASQSLPESSAKYSEFE